MRTRFFAGERKITMSKRRWLYAVLGSGALVLLAASVLAAPAFGPWGPAASVESVPGSSSEVNTAFLDGCPILSRDGEQLYMASDRPGGKGGLDIWVAEGAGPRGPFGAPENMGEPINSAFNDFCPSPLRDGQGFMFVSTRPGGCGGTDIYLTRRHPELGWEAPVNLGCAVNSPSVPVAGVNSALNDARPSVRQEGRELAFGSTRRVARGCQTSITRHGSEGGLVGRVIGDP